MSLIKQAEDESRISEPHFQNEYSPEPNRSGIWMSPNIGKWRVVYLWRAVDDERTVLDVVVKFPNQGEYWLSAVNVTKPTD